MNQFVTEISFPDWKPRLKNWMSGLFSYKKLLGSTVSLSPETGM